MNTGFRNALEQNASPEGLNALSAVDGTERRLRDDHHAIAAGLIGISHHGIPQATMERLYALEQKPASFVREWRPELTAAVTAAAAIAIVLIAGPWGKIGVDASAVAVLAMRLLRPRFV